MIEWIKANPRFALGALALVLTAVLVIAGFVGEQIWAGIVGSVMAGEGASVVIAR